MNSRKRNVVNSGPSIGLVCHDVKKCAVCKESHEKKLPNPLQSGVHSLHNSPSRHLFTFCCIEPHRHRHRRWNELAHGTWDRDIIKGWER